MNHELRLTRASRGAWIVKARRKYPPANGPWEFAAASRYRLLALFLAWWRSRHPDKETG